MRLPALDVIWLGVLRLRCLSPYQQPEVQVKRKKYGDFSEIRIGVEDVRAGAAIGFSNARYEHSFACRSNM